MDKRKNRQKYAQIFLPKRLIIVVWIAKSYFAIVFETKLARGTTHMLFEVFSEE